MNHQHLIDSAIFDTTFVTDALALEQQAEIEAFVKKDLMKVIDEVFDEIDGDAGLAGRAFRIGRLDLDLGEIPLPEYRQKMPRKLREKLLLALGDLRPPTHADAGTGPGQVAGESTGQEQLFYFLRNGYLPWYSRLDSDDALESLLTEAIARMPARLVRFLRENAHSAAVMERLQQQFPAPVVGRVLRLLASSQVTGTDNEPLSIDAVHAQLVAALLSGDAALMRASWQTLYDGAAELLETTLRRYGQQADVRQRIVAGFSPTQFVDLLKLLEPVAHSQVQAALQRVETFANKVPPSAAERSRAVAKLREFSLAYLLVERGDRFDETAYFASLQRQLGASSGPGEAGEAVVELTRQLRKLAAETSRAAAREKRPDAKAENRADPYRRYQRLKLALTTEHADSRPREPGLLDDISALAQDTPWLLLRLYRELQNDHQNWERAIASLPVTVLAELTDALLSIIAQAGTVDASVAISEPAVTTPSRGRSELAAAIRDYAEKSGNRQSFYAHIIAHLSKGELIDFDAIGAAEQGVAAAAIDRATAPAARGQVGELAADGEVSGQVSLSSENAPPGLLLCAELLTTASYTAGLALSLAELDSLKWRFIEACLHQTGNLFNEAYFSRQFVETLIQQGKVSDTRRFRESLSQGLQQNSLPSTREMTRRLVDQLANDSETSSDDYSASESGDEVAPLEDIHITNAGAVLFASYLPRLFERLGLIDEGQFKDREAAERGVHCVQYLVNASTSSPEYQLVLNKLLCGVRPGRPIRRSIELGTAEIEQLEGLLQAIIQHWKALGNTSIAGLRESFLQRGGRLQRDSDAWRLSVEGRSFDMLLEQIPWSFSAIKFPWMDRVIYVEWR